MSGPTATNGPISATSECGEIGEQPKGAADPKTRHAAGCSACRRLSVCGNRSIPAARKTESDRSYSLSVRVGKYR